jgi:hypothetical protein
MQNNLAKLHSNIANNTINKDEVKKDFINTIQSCLNAISEFFTYICGTKCAVCVKGIYFDKEAEAITKTLARDDISKSVRGKFDLAKDIDNKEIIHNIKDSTAFNYLTSGKTFNGKDYFSCNNLIQLYKDGKYKNTTLNISEVGEPETDYYIKLGENHKFFKYFKWTLPYKSTMVFPIKSDEIKKGENYFASGFLCIDANRKNIFNFAYQTGFGTAFSKLFYLFITQYYFHIKRYNKEHKKIA